MWFLLLSINDTVIFFPLSVLDRLKKHIQTKLNEQERIHKYYTTGSIVFQKTYFFRIPMSSLFLDSYRVPFLQRFHLHLLYKGVRFLLL